MHSSPFPFIWLRPHLLPSVYQGLDGLQNWWIHLGDEITVMKFWYHCIWDEFHMFSRWETFLSYLSGMLSFTALLCIKPFTWQIAMLFCMTKTLKYVIKQPGFKGCLEFLLQTLGYELKFCRKKICSRIKHPLYVWVFIISMLREIFAMTLTFFILHLNTL